MSAPLSRQVALIRGINVGKAKRIAMADLKSLVEALGYTDVKTLLNSGNVVFSMPDVVRGDIAVRIEKALMDKLIVRARVTVLSADDLGRAIDEMPFGDLVTDPARLLVTVLSDARDRERLVPLAREAWGAEAVALGTRVAYVWCPDGILASRANAAIGKVVGDGATSRNWATLTKLYELCGVAARV